MKAVENIFVIFLRTHQPNQTQTTLFHKRALQLAKIEKIKKNSHVRMFSSDTPHENSFAFLFKIVAGTRF